MVELPFKASSFKQGRSWIPRCSLSLSVTPFVTKVKFIASVLCVVLFALSVCVVVREIFHLLCAYLHMNL